MHLARRICTALLFAALVCSYTSSDTPSGNRNKSPERNKILLLDVDNTLYLERNHDIEAQIARNIHRFVSKELKLPLGEAIKFADELHHQFGSTIEGLKQTVWKDLPRSKLRDRQRAFYESVYSDVNCQSLLLSSSSSHDGNTNTGYSHSSCQQQDTARRILKSIDETIAVRIASNSPIHHIQKVIQALGLARVSWRGVRTPDCIAIADDSDSDGDSNSSISFPTKLDAHAFWGTDFLDNNDLTLIDDSRATIAACEAQTNIRCIHLHSDGFPSTLSQALGVALGWFEKDYKFSDVDYLRAKNIVDSRSINCETWNQVVTELSSLLLRASTEVLRIVDVGAGLLSMLKLVLEGSTETIGDQKRLPSLVDSLHSNGIRLEHLEYFAYEPNKELASACIKEMQRLGFQLQSSTASASDDEASSTLPFDKPHELIFVRPGQSEQPNCTVHLRFWDYNLQPQNHGNIGTSNPTPHLIVGCCFADLLQPGELVTSLMRSFLSNPDEADFQDTIVYFPITFCGVTQFLPPQPFEASRQRGFRTIPSDTTAFRLYSKALTEEHGHNIDPSLIESVMMDYGAECLVRGRSDWVIDPNVNNYFWRTMLYFFASVAASRLQSENWDAWGWLNRAQSRQPVIQVTNVDLLFRMAHLGQWQLRQALKKRSDGPADNKEQLQPRFYKEILFTGPRQVTAVRKQVINELKCNQIRIQTEYSLISSGTELNIFTGSFEDDALDVNIKGMDEERMTYPLAYGYSLVGRVVECGPDVLDAQELLGRRVFTFSAHASEVVTDRSAVQIVPEGMNALDAIFMPSVETALSLIQDARPFIGEAIALFGQGLIGLLVTALLSKQTLPSSGGFGTITTFDTIPDRLAASAAMGASQSLLPSEAIRAGPFDVAIEVSGNGRALQAAIDSTRDGGRIVIGSWYGNRDVSLKLGIDFHRSHKTLITSQVSEIPAELRKTWSKERRFALTWELVKLLKPSRLITRRTTLEHAQEAFSSLENGEEIAVAFDYR